jgi:hypothetical protein
MHKNKIIWVFSCICIIAISSAYFAFGRNYVQSDPTDVGGDPKTYYLLADKIVNELIYAENFPNPPFRAWRPPLYPIFLASLLWLGSDNLQLVVLIQYVLFLVSGGLVCYLYYQVFNSLYGGLVSAIVFLSFSPFYFYASYLFSETLFIFVLLAFLVVGFKAIRSGRLVWFVLDGFLLGSSILIRTVGLPILILGSITICSMILLKIFGRTWIYLSKRLGSTIGDSFPPCFWIKKNTIYRNIIVLLISAWIVIVPYTLRNLLLLDEFVLINTSNGMNLYFGTLTNFYREQDDWYGTYWLVDGNRWQEEIELIVSPLIKDLGEVGADRSAYKLRV